MCHFVIGQGESMKKFTETKFKRNWAVQFHGPKSQPQIQQITCMLKKGADL